ncbi:MAG: peptidyl-dipeptidase Dcp [Hyphomonadaceae bacterium]|nr:MAG: peptidyl-dipeptidase Dcp [Hyphomonadaceae bacterium]
MRRRNFLSGSVAAASTAIIGSNIMLSTTAEAATRSNINPLLAAWNTPFGVPPFSRFRPSHFKPAFITSMASHKRELAAISSNRNDATFDNVIGAMERAGADLTKVAYVFFHLTGAHTNPQLQAVEGEIAAKLSAHQSSITQDPLLFGKIRSVYQRRNSLNLNPAQMRLVERTYKGFVRGGAMLDATAKTRVAAIDGRLAEIQVKFAQNVLAGQSSFNVPLRTEADFAGLDASQIDAAKAAARERHVDAMGIITLSRSSFEPFLTNSTRRDLREQVQKGWMAVGSTGSADNRPLITEIVNLRTEKAKLLGFPSFAAFQLDDTMAKTPQNAMNMMERVWAASLATAKRERDALNENARADGVTDGIKSWDWWHYAEKVRKARFDVDENETKPYFELGKMIEAIHYNAGQLFGIRFVKKDNIPSWHPDVVAYEVYDDSNKLMAMWLGDFYTRPSKQSGAWMSSLRDQQRLVGDIKPIVFNVCNYTKPSAGNPTLLSFDDVTTLFHEFGHALHGMLSNVTYPSQSGTSVLRDFVEFPSQMLEHWAATPEILNRFAKHYQTQAVIPQELLTKLLNAQKFNQGWTTTEYLSAAIMDMQMHMITDAAPTDVDAWEKQILDRFGLIPEIVVRYRPGYFKHTFEGGYAAGYYSYIWAAVLETDAFNAFKETGNVYDPGVAARLKQHIFASGGTMDPMEAYIAFRGREPGVESLLEHRGLSV